MAEKDTKFSAQGGPASGWDVAVIGAGPAGMIAAGVAAENGLSVVLIEKNARPGRKLLLTGNGRCNLTNAEFSAQGGPASGWNLRKFVANYNNGEFLFRAFSVFGPKETIEFFEKLGVKTKIEKDKRVFPKSDDADDVLEALKKYLEKNKVNILYNSEIVDIDFKNKKINKLVLKNPSTSSGRASEITARKYILATGGKSYPQTGSNGLGYKLAEKLGHTIVEPMPALSPVRLKPDKSPEGHFDGPVTISPKASLVGELQGINLKDVKISLLQNNKKQFSEEGEIMFTHFGISGPAVLNISACLPAGREKLENGEAKICLDLFPLLNREELLKGLEDVFKKYPNRSIKNILSSFVPERLSGVLLNVSGLNKDKIANNMSKIEREKLIKILKNFELTPEDDFSAQGGPASGWDLAKITRGGISLKEIDHKTMKSKIIDNLFFAGEIIDVDGKTGGFNLQMCWSTGHLAGLVF